MDFYINELPLDLTRLASGIELDKQGRINAEADIAGWGPQWPRLSDGDTANDTLTPNLPPPAPRLTPSSASTPTAPHAPLVLPRAASLDLKHAPPSPDIPAAPTTPAAKTAAAGRTVPTAPAAVVDLTRLLVDEPPLDLTLSASGIELDKQGRIDAEADIAGWSPQWPRLSDSDSANHSIPPILPPTVPRVDAAARGPERPTLSNMLPLRKRHSYRTVTPTGGLHHHHHHHPANTTTYTTSPPTIPASPAPPAP